MQKHKLPPIREPTNQRTRRFKRIGIYQGRRCPWCYKTDVAYKATKKYVAFWCPVSCGYRVNLVKALLSYKERQIIYGSKKRKPP